MYLMIYLFILFCIFNNTVFCDSVRQVKHKKWNENTHCLEEFNEFVDIESKNLTLLDYNRRIKNSSCIATLVDEDSNKFILKQKLNLLLSHVLEKLAADIACSVGIPANWVELIPCNVPFIGKKKIHKPATLHTFVPGVLVNKVPKTRSRYAVSLRLVEKAMQEGRIVEEIFGITRDVIRNMSVHPDLPKIVALDTFLANHDRHRGNLFYDEETDHFYVIDLESSFKKNLAQHIYKYFAAVVSEETIVFSAEEVKGLVIYRDMLKQLIDKYSPDYINKRMDKLIRKAGIACTKLDLITKSKYQQSVKKNYASCEKIVEILGALLAYCNRETGCNIDPVS